MLLENKNAVIYGGGGSVGSAVTRAFARDGARVFLAGRILESLEEVAQQIRSDGGVADTAQLDALELPSIGWQLFILDSSQSDSTAYPSCLDT